MPSDLKMNITLQPYQVYANIDTGSSGINLSPLSFLIHSILCLSYLPGSHHNEVGGTGCVVDDKRGGKFGGGGCGSVTFFYISSKCFCGL